jgi:cytoskeleton-associated protein 5
LGDKLSDIKIKNAAADCLSNFTEATCPQFVFSQLYQHTAGHKNPKVTSEALLWMTKALEDFGTAGLDIKTLIDHVKACLDSTNAPTKTAATKLLVVLRIAVGPALSDFLLDIKKQLLDTIEKEFDKVCAVTVQSGTRVLIQYYSGKRCQAIPSLSHVP